MKGFNTAGFLLNNSMAIELYNKAAIDTPIFDFHCHLDPQEIWENKSFENITQVWLGGDHYKWRTMRMNGVRERYITGEASDWEKFSAWAETVPNLIGNPIYHWAHMELKTYFGIDKLLSPETAEEIWEECNAKLQTEDFKPRAFIKRSNVKFIGTTDDPVSTLEYHSLLQNDPSFYTNIAPTFRPDGAMFIERPAFKGWLEKLTAVTGTNVASLDDLLKALKERVDFFDQNGCRASDHDIPKMVDKETTKQEAETIFNKALNGETLTEDELLSYRWFLLTEVGKMYAEKQWVMQLHMGALRNNNTRMKERLGGDIGFDSIGDQVSAFALSRFLDNLDKQEKLPRTVLFNLNPNDNDILAGMMGNFYEEGVPGKVQFGSAWWFNDHIDGMVKQMKDLANVGLITHFIGMLTDSRSLLSYVRHDYFRRILCNLLGEWAEEGKVPYDKELLGQIVRNISYNNAEKYFLER
jgi:glucuronate isomerase